MISVPLDGCAVALNVDIQTFVRDQVLGEIVSKGCPTVSPGMGPSMSELFLVHESINGFYNNFSILITKI